MKEEKWEGGRFFHKEQIRKPKITNSFSQYLSSNNVSNCGDSECVCVCVCICVCVPQKNDFATDVL